MRESRLFNRTRIQLTGFYAIAIGAIALLSGYGIHLVMIRAFARTVDRELNSLSGAIHDTFESVLEQPGIVNSVGLNLLPGLCIVGGECSPNRVDSKISELTSNCPRHHPNPSRQHPSPQSTHPRQQIHRNPPSPPCSSVNPQ